MRIFTIDQKRMKGLLLFPGKKMTAHGSGSKPHYCLMLLAACLFANVSLFAQNTAPEGLHMYKTWTPDPNSATGSKGVVTLEAFVTGTSVTVNSVQPTDIVIVVDQSGSMTNQFGGGKTRLEALRDAVTAFVDNVKQNAETHNVVHKVAIVGFASNETVYNVGPWENTELLSTQNVVGYTSVSDTHYQDALVAANVSGAVNSRLTTAINRFDARGGTYMQYGLEMAKGVLDKRTETTYTDSQGTAHDRGQVVVFFTDGYPGGYSNDNYFYEGRYNNRNYDQKTVADAAVGYANTLKTSSVTMFSVGIFGGAAPDAAYTTEHSSSSSWNNNYERWSTATAAANGLLHFISSDYAAGEAASWSGLTTSGNNVAGYKNEGFYLAASNSAALSDVFTTIANSIATVPVEMGVQTIVQDQIAPNFSLPQGAQPSDILVYAPACTGVNTSSTPNEYFFEPIGPGNQLSGACTFVNGLIRVTGFDFADMWCGLENPGTPQQSVHGRKLVIEIPLEVEEGVWGDGLPTNGPLSLIFPDGDTLHPIGSFPIPTANVIGDVWTEIVTTAPQGFDPQNIDSPEDLAWFISVVNGRANYGQNSGVSPTPNANGKLTADIDMSAHNWIPIGSSGVAYTGTFDGNGHVLTGMKNNASKFYKLGQNVVVYPGMFGKVGNGGVVKNVFVLESDMRTKKHAETKIHYGILVDTLDQGSRLFNCEAAGRLSTTDEGSNNQLIFGGLVGLNNGGAIHSSMSMAQLTGFTMGGAVGENKGTFRNSFTNARYHYLGTGSEFVGGLAGINSGTVDNCYVRFERENVNLGSAKFGQLAGSNTGTLTNNHVPAGNSVSAVHTGSGTAASNYVAATAPYLYGYDATTGEALLNALNTHKGEGAEWKLTTAGKYRNGAGNINGDYPILKYSDYICAASTDGIAIDYANSLSDMLKRHNEGNLNVNTTLPQENISGYVPSPITPDISGHNYNVNAHPAVKGGTINLYANTDNSAGAVQSTADGVVVYIDENISLLQGANSTIEAYTCQIMTKPDEYWHTVSSSLTESGIGFTYGTTSQVPFSWDNNNPCSVSLIEDDDYNLFPHDAPVEKIDLFSFYEPQYHWINLKRNSASHWHMDDITQNIAYTNETSLTPGKGYLAAIDKEMLLQNRGTLNNGDIDIAVSNTLGNAWTGLQGYNLIGNPYQSYLDFDRFVGSNGTLWTAEAKYRNTYSVYDPTTDAYVQYMAGSSSGSASADQCINMHQGFFVVVDGTGTKATFTNAMRTNTAGSGFRGEPRPAYPLVNLIVADAKGLSDVSVIELGRQENTGARKMNLSTGNGRIYLRHAGDDYAILFRDEVKDYQALQFEAAEDGVYTLRWNTANAVFSSLKLIDNITGVNYDMLANDSYTFEAKTSDYKSRFKIVIGECTGIEEETADFHSFAFFDGNDWIVTGQGQLDLVDVLGRTVCSERLTSDQNRVNFSGMVPGVYVLRVSDNNNVKVQKIVLRQ